MAGTYTFTILKDLGDFFENTDYDIEIGVIVGSLLPLLLLGGTGSAAGGGTLTSYQLLQLLDEDPAAFRAYFQDNPEALEYLEEAGEFVAENPEIDLEILGDVGEVVVGLGEA
jgi:hypothetical protein